MSSQIVQLGSDELWTVLEDVDSVGAVLDELVTGAVTDPRSGWRRLAVGRTGGLAVLEDRNTGARCLLPAVGLRGIRTATLAVLAARHLLSSRVVTAAVLGWSELAELQLAVLARCVPEVTHVAICAASGAEIGHRILDQLDLAGIGLSVSDRVSEVVRGANLVHVLAPDLLGSQPGQLAKGAVVVNSVGRALPDDVMAGIDQVYVDHCGLLLRDRPWQIEADLTQLVTGTHPGRTRLDDIVLVELLGTNTLSAALADLLHRAAIRRGLGVRRAD